MGDIADALRRAREKESGVEDSAPAPVGSAEARASRATPDGASEASRRGELAPILRAARLETATPVARASEYSPPLATNASPPIKSRPRARRVLDRASTDGPQAERIALLDPGSPAAAASRRLAQQVKRQSARRGMTSIVVTSPLGGDGKTTVSCNLAVSLARLDRSRSVVLVDLDLRRPRVAASLHVSVEVGVDQLLLQEVTLDDALIETDEPGLSILAPRGATSTPEHLLASEHLRRLLDSLTRRFSMVIIDTPPILAVADALNVLDVADGCLMVVRAGKSPTSSVAQATEHLPAEKMLGCCLNFARGRQHSEGYYGYGPNFESIPGGGDASSAAEPRVVDGTGDR
jgi:capsular exopolysaccharide synthesis family protein